MRKSGILAAISSLPSPYGIGTLGKAAYDFVDFLAETGQYYWQILPINPPGFGNSPYQAHSAFAGNPYFIDLDFLVEDGLLKKEDLPDDIAVNYDFVNYSYLYLTRFKILKKVADNVDTECKEYLDFVSENKFWLSDYCEYMATKQLNEMKGFDKWSRFDYDADSAGTHEKLQFLFFRQWSKLKKYANSLNVHIIGDLPIYVATDSADFYFNKSLFLVDEEGKPNVVSGCPPDDFSPDGQLWGNPIYDWSGNEKEVFAWWKKRFFQAEKLFDVVRIDHFRGFYEYFSIDAEAQDAKEGKWQKGPGMKFVNMLRENFPSVGIIAEDLGFLNDDVKSFFKESGYPGMKILEFAFDDYNSEHMPFNHDKNCVVYTGTHDNPTVLGWQCAASPDSVKLAMDYFGTGNPSELSSDFIRAAYSSVAETAIIPIQDWLKKGLLSRMNTPSTVKNNWEYRFRADEITPQLGAKIRKFTKLYNR